MWSRAPAQGPLPVIRRLLRGSGWRREVLRANRWLVPAVEVVAARGDHHNRARRDP